MTKSTSIGKDTRASDKADDRPPLAVPMWTEAEYAAVVRKSIHSVRKDRARGKGPKARRIGGAIRYLPSDVYDFINASVCRSK